MRDPREGIDRGGFIRTGADRSRVPPPYEPVLAALTDIAGSTPGPGLVSLYVYGSVATGTARIPASDVDTVVVGLSVTAAATVGQQLSEQFADLCRAVEIGVAILEHYAGQGDAAYGNRAFLRHYCVHVCGPDLTAGWPAVPADARAARGFNGDLAAHYRRWREALDTHDGEDAHGEDAEDLAVQALARRIARKTLLAVAGLVSMQDRTWTTDRAGAAQRWGQLHPPLAAGLRELVAWGESARPVRHDAVRRSLHKDGTVHQIVDAFDEAIGMWTCR